MSILSWWEILIWCLILCWIYWEGYHSIAYALILLTVLFPVISLYYFELIPLELVTSSFISTYEQRFLRKMNRHLKFNICSFLINNSNMMFNSMLVLLKSLTYVLILLIFLFPSVVLYLWFWSLRSVLSCSKALNGVKFYARLSE